MKCTEDEQRQGPRETCTTQPTCVADIAKQDHRIWKKSIKKLDNWIRHKLTGKQN